MFARPKCRGHLWWLHSCAQVACPYGQRGRRIRLPGEERVERTLRSVEVGRAFEYFGPLDRWTIDSLCS
jgi:hypothetical protein